MIETDGFAIEPVLPDLESDPPRAGYAYTIGLPADVGFPEIVVFGMKPIHAHGLVGLVHDQLRGGVEIPVGVELVGLLEHELRCRFAPVDLDEWGGLFATAVAWYRARRSTSCSSSTPTPTASCPTNPASSGAASCRSRSSERSDPRRPDC